jgi:hypothetical protein
MEPEDSIPNSKNYSPVPVLSQTNMPEYFIPSSSHPVATDVMLEMNENYPMELLVILLACL